jgi:hypothetical protein
MGDFSEKVRAMPVSPPLHLAARRAKLRAGDDNDNGHTPTMSERLSRRLAQLEALFIALPVILLFVTTPLACACCLGIVIVLAIEGPKGLLRVPAPLWIGTMVGMALTALGLIVATTFVLAGNDLITPVDGRFGVFSMGTPMLLPALHAVYERRRAARAGNGGARRLEAAIGSKAA